MFIFKYKVIHHLNIGRTELDEALMNGNWSVAKLLIKHGATEFREEHGKKKYLSLDR